MLKFIGHKIITEEEKSIMTQKQKGYLALGGLILLLAGGMFGSEPLYNTIEKLTAKKVSYVPGTYEGTAEGFGGEIKAVVTITESGIESVKLTGDDETPELGGEALPELEKKFVEAQSAKVDAVSGCTYTSTGAINAVNAALQQAVK